MLRIAKARPAMLSTRATTKTAAGTSRERPAERLRAAAHTVSRTPDAISTSQDMTHLRPAAGQDERRLVGPGTTCLVREPAVRRSVPRIRPLGGGVSGW